MSRVLGETFFNRGIIEFRPRATEQDAETASRYDFINIGVERGVDLFALALLMATFRD
jgi:hypothetical protein